MALRRNKIGKKGYTLVEAMVVLVIIGIIASIAIGGLTMYQRYAAFKKNNEYAQTLFSAAQAALSHAKASGQLEELGEELKSGEALSGELKKGMIINGTNFDKRAADGGLYFLCYKKSGEIAGGAHKILYDMLEPYVYDDTILNASYCIEFDAVDGTVLGVLYSDRAKGFSYDGGSTTEAKETVHIANREKEARKKILLGYYGVESLSARAPQKSDKAFIKEIKLVNDETLYAEWTVDAEKSNVTADAMQFEFQLCRTDAEGKEEVIAEFTVNDSAKDENKLQKETGSGYVKCDVWFYDQEGKKADVPITYQFPAYIDEEQKMVLALDAVDTAAEGILRANPTEGILKEEDSELFKNTYSIRRFTDKPENVCVKIQAYATGVYETSASAWTLSNEENAYFAKAEDSDFDITNARHLFNVRFTERGQEMKSEGAANYTYKQKSDISWGGEDGIVGHGNVYTEMEKRRYNEENKTAFPTITVLADGNAYQGGNKTLRNLYMTDTDGPLGLFGINRGSISSLAMEHCVIVSETASYVGSFCGVNAGKLNNLTTGKNTSVTGGNYVGGIAGADGYSYIGADGMREAGKQREYKNLYNAASVTGRQVADANAHDSSTLSQPNKELALAGNFVGGIVSYVKGTYVSGGTEVNGISTDSWTNAGDVASEYSGNKGKSFVGGLAGYAEDVQFYDCHVSDSHISGAGYNDENGDTSAYVGGLIGYLTRGQIVKSFLEGKGSVTVNWGNVGGIVGKNDTGGFVGNCKTDIEWKIISKNYLNNTGCGGIIGFNASAEAIISNNNFAAVSKDNASGKDVVSTGGIIGRQESKELFSIYGCVNEGDVSAFTSPGGIVGRIKGAGGEISSCENWASIYTGKADGSSREGAGGIVANIYSIDSGQTVKIADCTNRGLIQGQYGGNGGIVASITGSGATQYKQIVITNCVNIGKCESIKDTKNNAGILAFSDVDREILITNCKNYGTGNGDICGIAANVKASTKLQGNFGVASCGVPVVPYNSAASVTDDNYYFSNLIKKKESIVQTVDYKGINISTEGKSAQVQSGNPISNLVDGSLNTRCSYEIKDSKTESAIMMVFQQPQELKTLDIYWYDQQDNGSNGLPREYSYTLSYLESGNEKLEDAKALFTEDGTEDGTPKVFRGIGYKNTYIKYADTVDLTDSLVGNEKVHGIVITVKEHSHTNRFVSLFEIAVNDDHDLGLTYEAEENLDTKGTPLGVTENGVPFHAMNRAKGKVVKNMLMNPLDIKTACEAEVCENAYLTLNEQLNVENGTLTDAEIGMVSGNGKSLLDSALETISSWGEKLLDFISPGTEEETEPKASENGQGAGSSELGEESPSATGGATEEEGQEETALPEPEKKEPLRLTETVLTDSGIPQTAVSWEEEEYVKMYDILLRGNQDDAYHYTLTKNPPEAEYPYRIMHETDKVDTEGNIIWEEIPARKDDTYPHTEKLSGGTTVTTYYYPLGYSRTIDGIKTEEQTVTRMVPAETGEEGVVQEEPQMIEETTTELVEVPCQTLSEAYLECTVYTKPDGSVSRRLHLVFPDIETAEGVQAVCGTESAYRFTYDMIITNQVSDEMLYEAPAPIHWWRELDLSGNWITKVREAGKENE